MKKLFSCALLAIFPVTIAAAEGAQPFKAVGTEDPLRKLFVEHSELKDPFSLQFRNLYSREIKGSKTGDISKHIYCGEVNAKNEFGAYTGWSLFYVTDMTDKPVVSIESDAGGPSLYDLLCKDSPSAVN